MYGRDNRERLKTDAFKKQVVELVEQELGEAMENLEQTVSAEISGSVRHIVAASLGLRQDGWRTGGWEINRTNGVDKGHPLGIAYRDAAETKALEIVTKALKDLKPTKAMLAAIRKEYNEQLTYLTREIAGNIAAQHASEWGEAFVNAELAKLDLEKVEGVPPDEKVVEAFVERARKRGVEEDAIAEILVLAGLTDES